MYKKDLIDIRNGYFMRRPLPVILILTGRWHVTISCQPDGRPPQPVRPWKIEWTRTFSRRQQCSCFRIILFYEVRAGDKNTTDPNNSISNHQNVEHRKITNNPADEMTRR